MTRFKPEPKLLQLLGMALTGALVAVGCTNGKLSSKGASSKAIVTTKSVSNTAPQLKINSVAVLPSSTANSALPPTLRLFFDVSGVDPTSTAPQTIADFCTLSSSNVISPKPCVCRYNWDEINATSGTSVAVPRTVTTRLSNVQSGLVECPAPDPYNTEILEGTVLKIEVIASGASPSVFQVIPYKYTKRTTAVAGSFQDFEGRSFDNILRYSCYEQSKRGLAVSNKRVTIQDPNPPNGAKDAILGSQFCMGTTAGNDGEQGCETAKPADFTSQAYFYNLYIRNTDQGSINLENQRYKCTLVREQLDGASRPASYFPLDSTFSLSLSPSSDFPIGVEAASKLGIALNGSTDPASVPSTCFGKASTTGGGATSLVTSCLGFAARPNKDGTCNVLKDVNGNDVQTYRLRRYVALYPPTFDANGRMIVQPQGMDISYVLDRPVAGSPDPTKPFTMRGPKPCPFSYFDDAAVTGARRYVSTSSASWNGRNVDGAHFPDLDTANSCSTTFPLLSDDRSKWTLRTVDNTAGERIYIRPVQSWAPHYEEDKSFQACAPAAAPFVKDPPLHFARDASGNVSWCAEVFPTLNPYTTDVGANNFTSHTVKNSSSAACAGPGGRCDRSVTNPNLTWAKFPLLADDAAVEAAITKDKSYNCAVTYDASGAKSLNAQSPSGGCCTAVTTSANPAHVEPTITGGLAQTSCTGLPAY